MKIKGAFIIPLVAIMIAMLTLGAVPGMATDTTVTESVQDSLTYIPTEPDPTSSLEQELEGFISDKFGDTLESTGDTLLEKGGVMATILTALRNALNSLIRILQLGGGMLGGSDLSGGLLGGLLG